MKKIRTAEEYTNTFTLDYACAMAEECDLIAGAYSAGARALQTAAHNKGYFVSLAICAEIMRAMAKNKYADDIKSAAAALGRAGGAIKSEAKSKSSAANGKNNRPHLDKIKHFESIFPHKLINNEWGDKFELPGFIKKNGSPSTYNPDYHCPELDCYIEVATSKPNISEQGPRWRAAIASGVRLRVFWWEGEEITPQFIG